NKLRMRPGSNVSAGFSAAPDLGCAVAAGAGRTLRLAAAGGLSGAASSGSTSRFASFATVDAPVAGRCGTGASGSDRAGTAFSAAGLMSAPSSGAAIGASSAAAILRVASCCGAGSIAVVGAVAFCATGFLEDAALAGGFFTGTLFMGAGAVSPAGALLPFDFARAVLAAAVLTGAAAAFFAAADGTGWALGVAFFTAFWGAAFLAAGLADVALVETDCLES